MQKSASDNYLKNAVLTATPEQLQLMLYDGAIRFVRQARDAMQAGDFTTSCDKLLRAQRIVVEMDSGLQHHVNPTLCDQLSALYRFVYLRLVDANMRRDLKCLDDALRILDHQRETWQILVNRIAQSQPAPSLEPAGLCAEG